MNMEKGRDVVELRYRPEVEDFTSALRARSRVSRTGWIQRWLPFVLGFGVLVEVVPLVTGSGHVSPGMLTTMAVALTLLLLMPWLQARTVKRLAERQGEFRVTVSDAGVTVVNDNVTASVRWAAQPRYRETSRVFVLLSDDRHATGFTMLPKRGLADPADADRLRSLLDRHLTRV